MHQRINQRADPQPTPLPFQFPSVFRYSSKWAWLLSYFPESFKWILSRAKDGDGEGVVCLRQGPGGIWSRVTRSAVVANRFIHVDRAPTDVNRQLLTLIVSCFLVMVCMCSATALLARLQLPSKFALVFFLYIVCLPVLNCSFLYRAFGRKRDFNGHVVGVHIIGTSNAAPDVDSCLLH